MARTDRPAPWSSRAVPPVETISTPRSASPRANSTSPRLSDTVSSARRTRTSPGWLTSIGPWSVVAIANPLPLDHDLARRLRVDPHPPGGDQTHGTRQQPVLDLVHAFLDRGDVTRIRKNVERLLRDDRPQVHVLVDEVDGHAHHRDAILDRLLGGPEAGEGGQQRRVDVDDPPREAADEGRAEDLHEAREHDQLDPALLEPVRERAVALRAVGVVARGEDGRRNARGSSALQPAGLRAIGDDCHDLDPVAPMRRVEDRLEVRALARDHHRDPHVTGRTPALPRAV